jgi:CRISPR-associated protein (TIGR03986 family)
MPASRGTQTFVNPYHFVPLGTSCDKTHNYREERASSGLKTGWIECKLTTITPIFIPNTTNEKIANNYEGKSYDFYSEIDLKGSRSPEAPAAPVIPGSELRGMLRSAYEAVTNACLSTTDDDHILYKRTTTPGKPGVIKKDSATGNWTVQPCQRIGIAAWRKYNKTANAQDTQDFSTTIASTPEGKILNFAQSNDQYKNRDNRPCFHFVTRLAGPEKGALHIGETFQRKHHESVFKETNAKALPITIEDLQNYIANIRLYRDDRVNQSLGGHTGYAHLDITDIARLENMPVYYAPHNQRMYLSPAAIGREVFHNRLKDLMGATTTPYTPCTKLEELCPGCVLFGIAGKDAAAVSRLSVTKATFCKENNKVPTYLEPMIPAELASPKPSATEFYLKPPNPKANLWNYDYAGNWGEGGFNEVAYTPEIQGRKFYWHGNGTVKRHQGDPDPKRHILIRPLDKGNTFDFKIHFNSITQAELDRLCWVLTIGGSKAHGHKIGMGKPIGLGSIQIEVTDIKIRKLVLTKDSLSYTIESEPPNSMASAETPEPWIDQAVTLLGGNKEAITAYRCLTTLEHGYNVQYPQLQMPTAVTTNPNAAFHWFVHNKQTSGGTGTRPKIDQALPAVETPTLYKIQVTR